MVLCHLFKNDGFIYIIHSDYDLENVYEPNQLVELPIKLVQEYEKSLNYERYIQNKLKRYYGELYGLDN